LVRRSTATSCRSTEQFRVLGAGERPSRDQPAADPDEDQIEQTQGHGRSSWPTEDPAASLQLTGAGRLLAPPHALVAGQWLPAAQRARFTMSNQRACSRASLASGPWARTDRGMGGRRVSACGLSCGSGPAAGCYLPGLHVRRICSSRPFHTHLVPVCGQGLVLAGPGLSTAGGEPLAASRCRCRRPGLSI